MKNTIQAFILLFIVYSQLISAQVIFTTTSEGPQSAFFFGNDLSFLGTFDREFDGQVSVGGRDLFLKFSGSGPREVISGFGVEEWIIVEDLDFSRTGVIKFFGSLTNGRESFSSTRGNSYAVLDFDFMGSSFVGKIDGKGLEINTGFGHDSNLALVILASDTIFYNDQPWLPIDHSSIVLAQTEIDGSLSLIKTIPYDGTLNIENLRITEDQWILSGDFINNLSIESIELQTVTNHTDGIILKIDENEDHIDHFTATGVFDVSCYDYLSDGQNEYYFGEYTGEVKIDGAILQDPMLNRSIFAYHKNSSLLLNIGGSEDDHLQEITLQTEDIIIGGYFSNNFQVSGMNETCDGDLCSYVLYLDKNLSPLDIIVDDSGETVLPYRFSISDAGIQYCGEFSGTLYDRESQDTDWFCILRRNPTNSVEQQLDDWNIYPNPVRNELYISDMELLNASGNYTYSIYDVNGILQLQGRVMDAISVGNLPSGSYYLRITAADSVKIFTFNKF